MCVGRANGVLLFCGGRTSISLTTMVPLQLSSSTRTYVASVQFLGNCQRTRSRGVSSRYTKVDSISRSQGRSTIFPSYKSCARDVNKGRLYHVAAQASEASDSHDVPVVEERSSRSSTSSENAQHALDLADVTLQEPSRARGCPPQPKEQVPTQPQQRLIVSLLPNKRHAVKYKPPNTKL